jgi:aminoglycoside 6'-N-acetyltransferase I
MVLHNVASDVFDNPINPGLAAEFLHDDHYHLAVALNGDVVVGFASGVTYVHPDKPLELWINEVSVASSHRNQGIGKQVIRAVFEACGAMGCREAWVLTDQSNAAAKRLYESIGGVEAPGETIMYSFVLDR